MNDYIDNYIGANRSDPDPDSDPEREKAKDKIFFYAQEIVHDTTSGWKIYIDYTDPHNCLTSMENDTKKLHRLSGLRKKMEKSSTDDGRQTRYVGPVLFSAGVILRFGEEVLMLRRDNMAPVDKLKWTSPAGRCDGEPFRTALKEFYEEVILFDRVSGKPVFVEFPSHEYSSLSRETYKEALKKRKFPKSDREATSWRHIAAQFPSGREVKLFEPVHTYWGKEQGGEKETGATEFAWDFFTFMDESCNTLEMRLVADVDIMSEEYRGLQLAFCDGEEYDREVKLLDPKKVVDADLVSAMGEFVRRSSAGRLDKL